MYFFINVYKMEQQPNLTLVSTPADDIEVKYITEVLKND